MISPQTQSFKDNKDNGGQNKIATFSEKVDKHYLKVPYREG